MADNTNRIAGVATVTVDGVQYMLEGELEYSPVTTKRETKKGQDAVHGYSEMPEAPYISGTFRDSGQITVALFNQMTNVTVAAKLANSKLVIGRNMWTVGDLAVKTQEGTMDIRWEGFQGAVTEN
ncbi:phage tail tube protein [Paraburkholderia terrae]|uniref:phage tail tube protein n=1 Tax=Paraburkholderia terrae TaxID=311230 RepID=UPI00296B015A|nr:phage tail tube protein [Paraburkholderia terrae]MDW3655469.1 phage tail tube protein [Paraburkholderia terrae]